MVRAFVTQRLVSQLETLTPAESQHILARVGDLAALGRLTSLAWSPLALHLALMDAALELLGTQRFRLFFRDMTVSILQRSPISDLVATAIRLLGVSPLAIAKWSPRGWALTFRAAGELRFLGSEGPGRARVALESFPPELYNAAVGEAVAAIFLAFYVVTLADGTVDMGPPDRKNGSIVFELAWRERAR